MPALADALLSLIQGVFVVALSSHNDQTFHSVGTAIALLVTPPTQTAA